VAEERRVELVTAGATLDVPLWRNHPSMRALRPALPGAQIADATLLPDGRLGLVVGLPGDERQAWTLDPGNHFSIDRLSPVGPRAPLAIRPDGRAIAFLHPASQVDTGSLTSDHLTELWLAEMDDEQGTRSGRSMRPTRNWST